MLQSAVSVDRLFSGFDFVIDSHLVGVAKPDPEFFAEAARRAGLSLEQMVHVGDHPVNDIAVARRSGMTTVWVNRSGQEWPLDEDEPDHEVRDLAAVAEIFVP